MARRKIGYSPRGPAVYRNVRRSFDGQIQVLLDEDEIDDLELDFTGFLEAGETISSVTVTPEGVAVTSTLSTPKITLNLSEATQVDSTGKVVAIITLSSGEIWRETIRVRRPTFYMDTKRIDGKAIDAQDPGTVSPGAGIINLTGQAPSIVLDLILSPAAESIVLTGYAPSVPINVTVTPDAESITVTGQTPTVTLGANVAPDAGSITVTGQQPVVIVDQVVQPASESITVTGQVPVVVSGADVVVQPGAGSVTVTGQAPALAIDQIIQPAAESITLTGQTPTVVVAGGGADKYLLESGDAYLLESGDFILLE